MILAAPSSASATSDALPPSAEFRPPERAPETEGEQAAIALADHRVAR